jgi:glycosyltransferase involved in cell wall biosynthesis
MSEPRVTIVTPSYNQAAYLEQTILSVLEQDYPNVEYIVIDDGSTDGSAEIIRRYGDRVSWWETRKNGGQVAALNHGYASATGEYLGWLNSDDVLLPGAITAVVEALEADPELLLVFGDNVFIDESGAEIGPAPAQEFDLARMIRRCENGVPQPGSLFRRRALEIAPLNERGYYFFDYEFAIRLGSVGKVQHLPRMLAGYRLHPQSKTVGDPVRKADDYVRVAEEFFAAPDFPEGLKRHTDAGRASAYLSASAYCYSGLQLGRARRYLLRALLVSNGQLQARQVAIAARSLLPRWLITRLRARAASARSDLA